MLIQPYYEQAQSFVKDGQHILARVKYKGLWGLIDQTGRFVLAPQYEYMTDCQYDRVGIKMENGYGFINKKGEVVIKPVFKKVKGFNQGLAPAQADNGLWGFISIHGKWIIQPAYADADSAVDNNRFPVKTGQYWGYIEKAGQTIVAPVYEQASAFSSGLARIYKKGIWGYLTLQGQIIWDTKNALFFENDETIPGKFKEKLLLALSKQAEFENINLKRILKARPWGGIPSDFLNNGSLVNDKNAELNFFNNFDNYNFIRTYLTSKVGQKPNPDWYRNNNWYGVIQIETKDLHQEETRWFWVELK
jgi:hypothetical protein